MHVNSEDQMRIQEGDAFDNSLDTKVEYVKQAQ